MPARPIFVAGRTPRPTPEPGRARRSRKPPLDRPPAGRDSPGAPHQPPSFPRSRESRASPHQPPSFPRSRESPTRRINHCHSREGGNPRTRGQRDPRLRGDDGKAGMTGRPGHGRAGVIPARIDRNPSLEAPPPRPRAGAPMDRAAPGPSRSRVVPGKSEHESPSTQSGISPFAHVPASSRGRDGQCAMARGPGLDPGHRDFPIRGMFRPGHYALRAGPAFSAAARS
jgi:hypothetical protein